MSASLPISSPLSADRLRLLAAEVRPLLPVARWERKDLLVDESAELLERLLVQVARLSRELRSRPLLREAVRSGEVSVKKAEAVLPLAVGDAEGFWVARARRESVRALREAAKGGAVAPGEDAVWAQVTVELPPAEREEVEEAFSLAGKVLGPASPRWQRVEALCQEYLGEHPAPDEASPRPARDFYEVSASERRAWLEAEHDRWSFLYGADPVPAPEPGVDDADRARLTDARLRELAGMRTGWDELLCRLALLLLNTGLWRAMGFADVEQYAAERLGTSGRALRQRAWLEPSTPPPLRGGCAQAERTYLARHLIATWQEASRERTTAAETRRTTGPRSAGATTAPSTRATSASGARRPMGCAGSWGRRVRRSARPSRRGRSRPAPPAPSGRSAGSGAWRARRLPGG